MTRVKPKSPLTHILQEFVGFVVQEQHDPALELPSEHKMVPFTMLPMLPKIKTSFWLLSRHSLSTFGAILGILWQQGVHVLGL